MSASHYFCASLIARNSSLNVHLLVYPCILISGTLGHKGIGFVHLTHGVKKPQILNSSSSQLSFYFSSLNCPLAFAFGCFSKALHSWFFLNPVFKMVICRRTHVTASLVFHCSYLGLPLGKESI